MKTECWKHSADPQQQSNVLNVHSVTFPQMPHDLLVFHYVLFLFTQMGHREGARFFSLGHDRGREM